MSHRCGFPADSGPCGRQIADDRDREHCWEHANPGESVSGAPSESLEGNDNACGNAGGSPPENNVNAAKHGGWSDPLKHYERLREHRPPVAALASLPDEHTDMDDDATGAFEWVESMVEAHAENYALVHDLEIEAVEADDELMDRLRALAAMQELYFRTSLECIENTKVWRVTTLELPNGETKRTAQQTVNPALKADRRLSQRMRSVRKELGITGKRVLRARRQREKRENMRALLESVEATDEHTDMDDDAATATVDVDANANDSESDSAGVVNHGASAVMPPTAADPGAGIAVDGGDGPPPSATTDDDSDETDEFLRRLDNSPTGKTN